LIFPSLTEADFFFRVLMIQMSVPVMGKLVPNKQTTKAMIFEGKPQMEPVCTGLKVARTFAPALRSLKLS
jgi:hypothetical protein